TTSPRGASLTGSNRRPSLHETASPAGRFERRPRPARAGRGAAAMTEARAKLVLASGSPRRLSLLEQVGIRPDLLVPTQVDETQKKSEAPRALTARLARAKAEAAAAKPKVRALGDGTFIL